jgi:hypothetical protein
MSPAPDAARTCNLQFRRLSLYPVELRVLLSVAEVDHMARPGFRKTKFSSQSLHRFTARPSRNQIVLLKDRRTRTTTKGENDYWEVAGWDHCSHALPASFSIRGSVLSPKSMPFRGQDTIRQIMLRIICPTRIVRHSLTTFLIGGNQAPSKDRSLSRCDSAYECA